RTAGRLLRAARARGRRRPGRCGIAPGTAGSPRAAPRRGDELRRDGPRARGAGEYAQVTLRRGPRPAPRPARRFGAEPGGNMTCTAVCEQLPLLVYGDLGPAEAAAVERHLAGCPACRAEHASLVQARAALDATPAPEVV